jgi:hypothetical protein
MITYPYGEGLSGEMEFHAVLPGQEDVQDSILACDEHFTCASADLEAEGTDTDGDGILDDADACPASDLRAMVILDGCTSGVENLFFEDGCSLADLVQDALASSGEAALADLLAGLQEEGVLTAEESEALVECVASDDEIADDEKVEISYRFYTAEKRSHQRLNFKPQWVEAIAWWIERYNKHCQPEGHPVIGRAVDLGDIINTARTPLKATAEEKTAAEADPQYYRKQHFATIGAEEDKYQWKPLWVVGQDELACFMSTNYAHAHRVFHIGLFDDVFGKNGLTHGVWYIDTNRIAVRANPATKAQRGRWHEMGHLFGLLDNSGGIMSKPGNDRYGDPDVWGKHWCETITTHLGISKTAATDGK